MSGLFGRARSSSTDPNKSNSGFMFAGLTASRLSGDVIALDSLGRIDGDVATVFRRMGYKPPSSGKLFDDYVAGGAGAQPLIVGYENQLIEWVLQDADRWKRVEASAPSKPVILYPRPTAFRNSADQHRPHRRRIDRCAGQREPARTGLGGARIGWPSWARSEVAAQPAAAIAPRGADRRGARRCPTRR